MRSAWLSLGLLSAAMAASGAGPCPIQNIRVEFTIDNAAGNRITSDASSIYRDGSDGVDAAIQMCSGSGDATMNTQMSKTRKVGIDLGLFLTPSPPSWTSTPIQVPAFLIVRHVMYNYSQFTDYSFTTGMHVLFGAPDGNTYRVAMMNPNANWSSPTTLANSPYFTSLVQVDHKAAIPGGSPETWTVYPLTETPPGAMVAGLIKVGTRKTPDANVGQFDVPFKVTITRLP